MTWQKDIQARYSLNDSQIDNFEKLLGLLKASKDRGLTAVTGDSNIVNFHFYDSLSLLGLNEVSSASSAVDVGSGAGFPGLPLAVAMPQIHVTLLDSSTRKCEFLSEAAAVLKLTNVDVVHARSEEAATSNLRDHFDIAFARALGPLATAIEYTLPLVRPGGFAALQRGAAEPGDEKLASEVVVKLNGSFSHVLHVVPYPSAKNLHIWIFKKIAATPSRFPRKPGLARKRPLSGH